jgi:hypothetical protein
LAACGSDACKQGTLFLAYSLPADAQNADTIRVTLAISSDKGTSMSVMRQSRSASGSIEIDFSGAYPAGKSLSLTVSALAMNQVVASVSQLLTAKAGCTALSLMLMQMGSGSDLGTSSGDAASDGSTPLCPDDAGSDVGCGGSCPPCAVDKRCLVNSDCITRNCSAGFCTPVSGPPNWLPLPSPIMPGREYISSTTDLAGRVYAVAGGSGGGVLSNVQCWDPSKGTWITLAPVSNYGYGLVTSRTGFLHMFGGASAGGVINTVQVYDPTMDKWSAGVNLPGPLYFLGAVTGPDGRLYTIGGASGANGTGVVTTFQAFDLMTKLWSPLQSLPGPLLSLAAAVADGRIFVIGGVSSNANTAATAQVLSYSLSSNSWTPVAPLPAGARSLLSAVTAPDGRIYAIGGTDTQGTVLTTVEAYHPATDRWVKVASLATARMGFGAAVGGDGRIYAIGGGNPPADGITSVEVYGPTVSPSPASAAVGAQVTVSGSNFAAGATVQVWLDQATGPALGSATTDSNGALSSNITFAVPATSSGTHSLIAVDELSQYPTTATLTVP